MKRKKTDDTPPGGWLGPPPTIGLKPLREFVPGKKGRKGQWVTVPQSKKDRKLRGEWERRLAKADKKGKWRFKWTPEDLRG